MFWRHSEFKLPHVKYSSWYDHFWTHDMTIFEQVPLFKFSLALIQILILHNIERNKYQKNFKDNLLKEYEDKEWFLCVVVNKSNDIWRVQLLSKILSVIFRTDHRQWQRYLVGLTEKNYFPHSRHAVQPVHCSLCVELQSKTQTSIAFDSHSQCEGMAYDFSLYGFCLLIHSLWSLLYTLTHHCTL